MAVTSDHYSNDDRLHRVSGQLDHSIQQPGHDLSDLDLYHAGGLHPLNTHPPGQPAGGCLCLLFIQSYMIMIHFIICTTKIMEHFFAYPIYGHHVSNTWW